MQPTPVLTVSELNQSVAHLLERTIPLCWIAGEVSNFTRAASGHWYFTLKDQDAQVRAVMFKNRSMAVGFIPSEGDKIEVRATVTLYAPRGDYQLCVENIRHAGLGNLYEAFLKLKQKLGDAGLFAIEHKKTLPTFPTRIGIVTSPQAAALRDILITLERRTPHIQVVIYPTPVQGNEAGGKIAQAVQLATARNECNVLLLARGGGSIEDLWAFNEEQVAHAIFACPIPIITGIGHETDFTIADFVADVRAPTPTAAAEMAGIARVELLMQLENVAFTLRQALRRRLNQHSQSLDLLSHRLMSPMAAVNNARLKLSGLQMKIGHALSSALRHSFFQFEQLRQRLLQQTPNVSYSKNQLQQLSRQLQQNVQRQLAVQRQALDHLTTQLELLNPQRTLERGYAIVFDKKGKVLRKPAQFKAPSNITVRLAEGEIDLNINSVQQHF